MTDSGPITPGNVGFMKQPTHAKALREMFDAGWKAAARFCDRDDAVADGIVGFDACSQFESAFAEALRDQRAGVATPAAPAQPGQERGDLPPLPDADLRDVGTTSQEIRDFLRGYATEYARTALAARAAPQPAVTAGAVDAPAYPPLPEADKVMYPSHSEPYALWGLKKLMDYAKAYHAANATPQPATTAGDALEAAAKIAEGYPKYGDSIAEEIRALLPGTAQQKNMAYPADELLQVALAYKQYIDALPGDVVAKLPAMPGIDGDWAGEVLDRAARAQTAPAPGVEQVTPVQEIDTALHAYAQAFTARVNGWTSQNGDDFPGARVALFKAISAYSRYLADQRPPAPTA